MSYNESTSDGSLLSNNMFYDTITGIVLHDSLLNQQIAQNAIARGFDGIATYTEPLGKRSLIEVSYYQLLFSDSTSLYKAVPEENAPDPFASPTGGGAVVFRMGADGSEQFRNFRAAKLIESRDLGAKTYLIEDSIKQQPWKLTDETKTILNYTCKNAIMQTERGQNVEAWYTESIPCPAGPESFANLPGVILQLDVNKGEVVYTATNVSATVAKNEIQPPKKGKKITRQEYSKMMQDMLGAQPGGGRVIMRMN